MVPAGTPRDKRQQRKSHLREQKLYGNLSSRVGATKVMEREKSEEEALIRQDFGKL